jgi:hypothetical protein
MQSRRGRLLPITIEIVATVALVVLLPCFCLFLLTRAIPTDESVTENDMRIIASEICKQAEVEGLLEKENGESTLRDRIALEMPAELLVQRVARQDTDGDGEREWVVFYQFDLTPGRSPYAGAIYDFDRGNPPILFPYQLLPPDRNYLSEGDIELNFENIVELGEAYPVSELFVYGRVGDIYTDLTIFRHVPNSYLWESPRDEPRRYQVIGSFRGDGGITFDRREKTVTVLDRVSYDRSQLVVKTVYGLDTGRGTYMDPADPNNLMAPVSSRVTFAYGMPSDILDTPFPEKLVLGFYESLVQKPPNIGPEDFLTGQARIEYDRGNLAYFGFDGVTGKVNEVKVTQLSYAPDVEKLDPSITVLGQEPRLLTVSVAFEAQVGRAASYTPVPIQWVTTVVNGKWKIDRRL